MRAVLALAWFTSCGGLALMLALDPAATSIAYRLFLVAMVVAGVLVLVIMKCEKGKLYEYFFGE